MTINNAVAGVIIMVSLLLAVEILFNEPSWLWLTFFIGFNLFQSASTGFCPAAIIFKAIGLKN